MQPADHHEVLVRAHQPVDGRGLRGHADALTHRERIGDHVDARDRGRPLGGSGERGEDADRRGLARAVVAEQTEHGAGRDVEIEVPQGPELVEPLPQPAGGDPAGAVGVLNCLRMTYGSFVHSTTHLSGTVYE